MAEKSNNTHASEPTPSRGPSYWMELFKKERERYASKVREIIATPLFVDVDTASSNEALIYDVRWSEPIDGNGLGASHWSCGCLNTYHPRFECPSMSESERAEHKARSLDYSAADVCSTAADSLYEECLATQDVPAASSVGSGDQEAARLFGSAVYGQFRRGKMFERARLVESDAYQATRRIGTAPVIPELEAANRTIAVLREGIDKANAEIMRLRDELARRPAAFVEPEPDKPNPFRDFTTDRRRMGPL